VVFFVALLPHLPFLLLPHFPFLSLPRLPSYSFLLALILPTPL
jgi:hypothetical protein